jgi:hypothetical protein
MTQDAHMLHDLLLFHSCKCHEQIRPSATGGPAAVKDYLYRTMSHYSFCRIMALQDLMVEAVLPMTLTLNMFVHLEQEEGDKLIPLVMNLPGFKMTCSVSQHQVLFYCGDTINSYVISVLYFT